MYKPQNILFPVNVDDDEYELLPAGFAVARGLSAKAHIFYVNDPQAGYRHPGISAEALEERVRENVKATVLAGVETHFAVSRGDLGREVKKYCTETRIDLIITTHTHHMMLFGKFLDTPDELILDAVEIPVLVIPKKMAEHLLDDNGEFVFGSS